MPNNFVLLVQNSQNPSSSFSMIDLGSHEIEMKSLFMHFTIVTLLKLKYLSCTLKMQVPTSQPPPTEGGAMRDSVEYSEIIVL